MLLYIGHIISITLYIAVIVTVVSCIRPLRSAQLHGHIKLIIPVFLASLLMQATLFIGLQVDWITEDLNSAVGPTTSFAWLAFDYFNGFALLSFVTGLRIWLGWKSRHGKTNYGRRSDDL